MKEAIKIKLLILMGILGVMLLGCEPEEKEEAQVVAVKNELAQTERTRDSLEASMTATLDEINRRIGMVKSQKGFLVYNYNSGDVKNENKKEQILNNIALMNELIYDNETRIEKLRAELKKTGSGNKELRKRIERYKEENGTIAAEVSELKTRLDEERAKNDKLAVENERLNIENSNQVVMYDNLHTQFTKAEQDAYVAYVAKGSRRELKKENVIEKKNILTFAAPDEINAQAPKENFEKIDTRMTLTIPMDSKKAKLVTTHDENSYKWCDEIDGTKCLCIVDPQVFWEKSKYLVVETK